MEQELIVPSKMSLAEQEWKDALVLAMEEVGITPIYIARGMKNIMDNAMTESKKWTLLEDYVTKLAAYKAWHKMQKDTPDVQIQIANIFKTGDNIL